MNIPNILTIARIFFVPLLVAVLVQEKILLHWNETVITNDTVALAIFLLAAATDLLDGYLARRWSQVTTAGTLLDPIADKLLVSAALIALVQRHVVPGWLVVLLIGREFAVSGLRGIAAAEGYIIKASELGKVKTFCQVVAISFLMVSVHHPAFVVWANIALYLVVLFSMWSAFAYFGRFWRKVDIGTKQRGRHELLTRERARRRIVLGERREARLQRKTAKVEKLRGGEFARETPDLPPSA